MASIGSTTLLAASTKSVEGLDLSTQREEAVIEKLISDRVKLLEPNFHRALKERNILFNPTIKNIPQSGSPCRFSNGKLHALEKAAVAAHQQLNALRAKCREANWQQLDLREAFRTAALGGRVNLNAIQEAHDDIASLSSAWDVWVRARDALAAAEHRYACLCNSVVLFNPLREKMVAYRMQKNLGLGNPQKMAASRAVIANLQNLIAQAEENARALLQTEKEDRMTHRQLEIAEKILSRRLPAIRHIAELLLKDNSLVYEGPYKKEVEHYLKLQKRLPVIQEERTDQMMNKTMLFKNIKIGLRTLGENQKLQVRHIDEIPAEMDQIALNLTMLILWLDLAEKAMEDV